MQLSTQQPSYLYFRIFLSILLTANQARIFPVNICKRRNEGKVAPPDLKRFIFGVVSSLKRCRPERQLSRREGPYVIKSRDAAEKNVRAPCTTNFDASTNNAAGVSSAERERAPSRNRR